ncbi:MAG: hypothetical protein ACR2NC_04715 [Thermodesulfobacteriota bacterium]
MAQSTDNSYLHDWVIRSLTNKYAKMFTEINVNPGEEKNFEFNGKYPDAVFVNYGQVMQIVEVETSDTVNEERIEHWKEIADLGAQLVILVPKESEKIMRDISFNSGLAAKVKIGTFGVDIKI